MSAVLVLGLDPEFVSPERMGGFSPAVVRAYLDAQFDRIRGLGHEVESCLVDFGETVSTPRPQTPPKPSSAGCDLSCAGVTIGQPIFSLLTSRVIAARTFAMLCRAHEHA